MRKSEAIEWIGRDVSVPDSPRKESGWVKPILVLAGIIFIFWVRGIQRVN